MKKKYFIILMIFINSVALTGCWNYKDINDMRFLSGMAVDYNEEKEEFIVTAEIINPISEELKGEVFQARGKSVFDGIRDIIIENGRKLYVAHAKVLIVSEYVAKNKMLSVVDYISRDAEYRDDIYVLVSKGKAAKEILEVDVEHTSEKKGDLHTVTGYLIQDILKNEDSNSKYHKVPLWRFNKALQNEGESPTLPVIKVYKNNVNQHDISQVFETAVFNKDKFVGYLNREETKYYIMVIDELKGGIVVVESKFNQKLTKVSLEIFNSKTKVKSIYTNDELSIKIDIENTVNIAEIGGTSDFISKEGREKLKKDAEEFLKSEIEKTIKKVQKEYKSDIFNFSTAIKKRYPNKWKEIKNNWEEVFSNLKVEVNVNFKIRGSAINSKPLTVSD